MTVRKHALKAFKHLNLPVSYKILTDNALSDSRNVFDNKGVMETRYGIRRFNTTSLGGSVLSLSYFKTNAGTRYRIAKVGTSLYSVAASGAHTVIKSGLSEGTKHRAVTLNNRHIISVEGDGLFSYDGSIFTTLGQSPPSTGSVATSSGGTLADATIYKVGLTFYASSTGFETNVFETASVTTASPNKQIVITSIPTTATNGYVDKVRVYLRNSTTATSYLFVTELSLGTSTYTVSTVPTSTQIPPTKNAAPLSGGGSFMTLFGKKLAYAGNTSFLSEVFISEEYLPDAFNDIPASKVVLQIPGDGPITGIATGLYDQQFLNPYIAIFKKSTVSIYSELNNIPSLVTLDTHHGCISNETIKIRNGGVYFMSDKGWHGIVNGVMLKDAQGQTATLGLGAVDDIFTRVGWSNELNIPQGANFFSCYYLINSQYFTFVSEGSSSSLSKAYVYEESTGGFKIFSFKTALTCGVEAEDDNGYQVLYLGDGTGTLFSYSTRNDRTDNDASGVDQTIPAFAILPYIQPGEDSNSYNFRTMAVRAYQSLNQITVRAFPSFSLSSYNSFLLSEFESVLYDFTSTNSGFQLDVSRLDVDVLGDERVPVTAMADLNLTGETLLVGFYQDILNANIGLISAQVSMNKNGNRNA